MNRTRLSWDARTPGVWYLTPVDNYGSIGVVTRQHGRGRPRYRAELTITTTPRQGWQEHGTAHAGRRAVERMLAATWDADGYEMEPAP